MSRFTRASSDGRSSSRSRACRRRSAAGRRRPREDRILRLPRADLAARAARSCGSRGANLPASRLSSVSVTATHRYPRRRASADARRPRGPLPRAPARGGAGPRGRPRAGAVRAADGVGQVGRLLPRHGAAARARRRPGADRVAAAGADAQPDRGRRAARDPRADHQLDQPRGLERGARPAGRGRGGPAADQPGAAQQPALPRGDAAALRLPRRARGRRRGALHQRLGA